VLIIGARSDYVYLLLIVSKATINYMLDSRKLRTLSELAIIPTVLAELNDHPQSASSALSDKRGSTAIRALTSFGKW